MDGWELLSKSSACRPPLTACGRSSPSGDLLRKYRPKPPSVLPRCSPARHCNKGYPYRDGNRLGTKCRPAQSRLWTGCRASSSGCLYSGDQRSVAVGHGVAFTLPRQPGTFLPIQIRCHLLGRIPKIGNCHDFYIVAIQKHTPCVGRACPVYRRARWG